MEKINESSSGQPHRIGEIILKNLMIYLIHVNILDQ